MVANVRIILGVFGLVCALGAQTRYDLLLKGGHVIDPKNRVDRVMDVAVSNGKIARVAENIPASAAAKTIDVARLYVTPGLIDLHAHLLIRPHGPTEGVQPDAFSFRSGVTTMVDAGSTGWREFPEFRDTVIKPAKTRVLSLLNIAGAGMLTGKEGDPAELDAEAAAKMARANPDIIVGFKSAHYAGPAWESIDAAVTAGNLTGLPVMVDFGRINERTLLFGPPRGIAAGRQAESGHGSRPEARHHLRHRPRRGQFLLVRGRAGLRGTLPSGFDIDGPAHQQHERGHEGHDPCHVEASEPRLAARGRNPHVHVESRERDQAAAFGESR